MKDDAHDKGSPCLVNGTKWEVQTAVDKLLAVSIIFILFSKKEMIL